MGVLQVVLGFVFIMLNSFAVKASSKWTRDAAGACGLVLAYFLFGQIRQSISLKMGGYNDGFLYRLL